MGDFLMPSLGADMEHGKIVEWLVKRGDYVRRGDIVAVVDTDKTVMDVEFFEEGVVEELLVDIGETSDGNPAGRDHPDPCRGRGSSSCGSPGGGAVRQPAALTPRPPELSG